MTAPGPLPPMNVLIAYPYMTKPSIDRLKELEGRSRWLLDSGAFTAWKMGIEVTLDSYCNFIEKLPTQPWRYFTLDVIGKPDKTRENYNEMRRRGFKPIPIFTRGCSMAELDAYYETSDLVGLGGVAGADRNSYSWVRAVMEYVGDRKAHILGFTSLNWLKFCKPYSVDSSSWLQAARYGTGAVYMGQGNVHQLRRERMGKGPPPREVMMRMAALGFDPYAMQDPNSWKGNRSHMSQLSATSWLAASFDIEKNIGTMLFLALANEVFLRNLSDAYDRLGEIRAVTA